MQLKVAAGLVSVCFLVVSASYAQQVGTNVNMVTGTQWPGGDPFLQRQNEPSMAISSRNPLHVVAGDNDYRSVDLPIISGEGEPTGDAWLGFFTSFDGGQTWTSNLVPGYPQDKSLASQLSPIHGLGAGADPTVRAGSNGMFFYSGLAFNRQVGGTSKVFLATYTDDNNLEGGNTIRYLWTTTVAAGNSTLFEDKPSIAVDIPRPWSGVCVIPALPLKTTQIFRAPTVYAAWTQFTGPESNAVASIMYARSMDCGLTWSRPQQISGTAKTNQGASLAIDHSTGALYIAWRVFASTNPVQNDAIMYAASFDGGGTFSKPQLAANITPFDQGDTAESFRTNDYPQIAVDASSRVYMTWSQRNVGTIATNGGDARIVVATGTPTFNKNMPLQWGALVLADPNPNRGHQIMPGMAFSAGKLTVSWYDLRNDDLLAIYTPLGRGGFSSILENDGGSPDYPAFGIYIQDPVPPYSADARRQTIDVRAAQAVPGNPPTFFPSVQVTNYEYGSVPGDTDIQQLQVDPPNLPMFQSGTLPFFGDYIDVAGPTPIPNPDGTWRFNDQPTDPDFTHIVWADNRDVVPPADGNWADYTPPTYGTSSTSIFDPTQLRPACTPTTTGNTGDRNQNIYTAGLTPGLVLSSPGNSKQLGKGSNGQLIQRQFAIVAANTTTQTRFYQLTVAAQPVGGAASFLQFPVSGQPFPLTQAQVEVLPLSSNSRGIFVTSTNAHATVTVTAAETDANGNLITGGETASVTINGDPNNPANVNTNISVAESYTPTIATPNIANPNIANPNIANPNIANPNIANPNIANPNIANPNIANPNIANPNIANPNIANPNIANPNIANATITDGTWAVTNSGNTSSAYAVNLTGQNPPPGVNLQLIVYRNYTTPLAQQCTLTTQSHFVPVANITNVTFATLSQLLQPAANNPTVPGMALAPGQTAFITLRVLDTTTSDPAQALQHYNPITQATPTVAAQGANTGTTTPPLTLTILTKTLPQATVTGVYPLQALQAAGGTGAYTWSLFSGALPTGISLTNGAISGTPTGTAGTYSFTVQVKDVAGNIAQQQLTLVVNPAPVITTTTLPAGDQGSAYSQPLSVTGGTPPLSAWSISSGSLPANLAVNGSTITGTLTPTATTSTFTVKISDANAVTATRSLTITVNAPPSILTTSLPVAVQGSLYSRPINATGGTGTLTFSPVTVDGVTLSPSGTFAGIPISAGAFQFAVTVTDSLNVSAMQQLTLTVGSSLSLLPATLAGGDNNVVYQQQQLVAVGGTPPYGNWVLVNSTLPPGLSLSSSGAITGTPTAVGTYPFVVSVSDFLNAAASQTYSITVNLPPTIAGAVLPVATVNQSYPPYTIPVSNGTAPFTWSQTGMLPAGLTFANGVISGLATGGTFASPYDVSNWSETQTNAAGTSSIAPNCLATVTVNDAVGGSSSANFQVGSTPSSSCSAFGYAIDLSNPPGSGVGGSGVPLSTWTFQNTAATSGTLTFNWQYVGFHSFFEVTAMAQVFSGSNVVTLYSAGPVDCCTTPSAGFNVQGTGTISVTAGQTFGFTVGGSNGDLDSVLNGTLYITNFVIQ
ncbi:MAG TPA: putative Ig domain-containing protein [Candidatus Sulfotelmatobacter sp.]|nr:putative Ig domain-containing protein [Candidatus Sulfotelmatobacter sp.]